MLVYRSLYTPIGGPSVGIIRPLYTPIGGPSVGI